MEEASASTRQPAWPAHSATDPALVPLRALFDDLADGAPVVVLAPHPDDESLATGGLIQVALARGARVTVILLTDGDNNPWPQRVIERRWRMNGSDRARWGRRRRAEAASALSLLGLNQDSVHCLGWPDMGLTARVLHQVQGSVQAIAALFTRVLSAGSHASTLVLPSLADRHPDHSATHVLAELALTHAQLSPRRLGYMVHGEAGTTALELSLDNRTRERKVTAVEQHRTQLVLSRRRMLSYAQRPERFVVEPERARARLDPRYVVPWVIGRVAAHCSRLLVATPAGTWVLPLTDADEDGSGCEYAPYLRRRGKELTLELPISLRQQGPLFLKQVGALRSPWIYDHWGWVRLDVQ